MASVKRTQTVVEVTEFTISFDDLIRYMDSHEVKVDARRLTIIKSSPGSTGVQYGELIRDIDNLVLRWESREHSEL